MIAQVKAKDLGGYTDESVRAVRDALAAAEKVAADPDATQVASLNTAVDGLKAKDDGDKPGPGDGGKPGAGDGKPDDGGKPDPGKPGKGDETKPDTGE